MSTGFPGDPPPEWAARSHHGVSTHEELALISFVQGWILPAGKTLFCLSVGASFFSGMLVGRAGEIPFLLVLLGIFLVLAVFVCALLTVSHVDATVHRQVCRILEREKVIVVLSRCRVCNGPTPCRCSARAEEEPPEVA